MKILNVVALVLLLLLASTVPAFAVPPDTVEMAWTEEYELFSCGDFDVWLYNTNDARITTHFDRDGNPLRVQIHQSGIDRVYNLDHPEKYLEGRLNFNIQMDATTPVEFTNFSASGLNWQIIVPGYGRVFFGAGRLVVRDGVPVVETGHPNYDAELLCTLLR